MATSHRKHPWTLALLAAFAAGSAAAVATEESTPMTDSRIPGYAYGEEALARSPISLEQLELMKAALLFGPADEKALRQAGEVLSGQIESILDVWYGFVASQPHLVRSFAGADGKPDGEYLAAVRRRFGRWILDTCDRPYDQKWLDWQHELALRHHRTKKNRTDGVSSVPIVEARYLIAFIYPITATIEPFLRNGGHSAAEVEAMHQAWFKAVTLQVALWTEPYVREGDY